MKISLPPQMNTKAIGKLFQAIPQADMCLRFVGGCVRDAIIGQPITDIDFATYLKPEEILKYLESAGIQAIPTGLSHGTVTAVIDKHPFEITTLRHDVETDGRHATVAFTDQWQEDAKRRDFTFNALYMDRQGQVEDYFSGLEDLHGGHVRFIGNPHDRIREDYLRILRFFRFYSRYGRLEPDAQTLQALKEEGPGLQKISRERITKEILILLSLLEPLKALKYLDHAKLSPFCFGVHIDLVAFETLLSFEKSFKLDPHPIARLAALSMHNRDKAGKFFKLSNDQLKTLQTFDMLTSNQMQDPNYYCYYYGPELTLWAALLQVQDLKTATHWFNACKNYKPQTFPLKGSDFQALGLKGKDIGAHMTAVTDWWIAENFQPSREQCLLRAEKILV